MKSSIIYFLSALLCAFNLHAEIISQPINYSQNGTVMKGMLVFDDQIKHKRPGVLVVHEWWGHNDYARQRARMLAELGYTALAVDMYGDGKTADHPKEAGAFSRAVGGNLPLAKARFEAAMEQLKAHESVADDKIAAIGYCFGGGIVLQMARMGVDLDAVASFHGSLTSQQAAQKGKVKARVRVYNGAADPFVKAEHVQGFKAEMSNAGVDYQLFNYPNAKHAFTNPGADKFGKKFNIPLAYNKKADRESWQDMSEFLKQTFK